MPNPRQTALKLVFEKGVDAVPKKVLDSLFDVGAPLVRYQRRAKDLIRKGWSTDISGNGAGIAEGEPKGLYWSPKKYQYNYVDLVTPDKYTTDGGFLGSPPESVIRATNKNRVEGIPAPGSVFSKKRSSESIFNLPQTELDKYDFIHTSIPTYRDNMDEFIQVKPNKTLIRVEDKKQGYLYKILGLLAALGLTNKGE